MINAQINQQRFWHCHENRLGKKIQTITENLYLFFNSYNSQRIAKTFCRLSLAFIVDWRVCVEATIGNYL